MPGELLVFAGSTLMQTWRLRSNVARIALDRLRHTSSVGGVSVTEHTALAVMPQRPCGPAVVITLTAAPRWAIACRKAFCALLGSTRAGRWISVVEDMGAPGWTKAAIAWRYRCSAGSPTMTQAYDAKMPATIRTIDDGDGVLANASKGST